MLTRPEAEAEISATVATTAFDNMADAIAISGDTNSATYELNLPKPEEGTWSCDICLVPNPPGHVQCLACETVRPGASVVAEQAVAASSAFTFGTGSGTGTSFSFGTAAAGQAANDGGFRLVAELLNSKEMLDEQIHIFHFASSLFKGLVVCINIHVLQFAHIRVFGL